jgi:Tfp pilus assembly protein PilO
MSQQKKYQYGTVVLVLLFLYLFATEVPDRWRTTFRLYDDIKTKEELNPEKLAQKKMELRARHQELMAALVRSSGSYDQSRTGVLEYLNASARQAGVKFESLVPSESESAGQMLEIGFKIGINSGFHRIGTFINTIEKGTMCARIRKIEVQSRSESGSNVNAMIEGSVTILPKRR